MAKTMHLAWFAGESGSAKPAAQRLRRSDGDKPDSG